MPPYLPPGFIPALMQDHYDSLSKIAGVTAPLLILHGEHDGVVPVAMGRRLLDAARGDKEGVFLAEAGHNNIWDNGGAEALLAFLERLRG